MRKVKQRAPATPLSQVLGFLVRSRGLCVDRGPYVFIFGSPIKWLRVLKPEFDFLGFDEARRLVAAADGDWSTMILEAIRTGLRQGELLALRWDDVDLVAGA